MQSQVDRSSRWRSMWARWQDAYREFCSHPERADALSLAGARQLSLYELRVSTVPTWEFLSASSVSAQSGRPASDRTMLRGETN